MSYTVVLYSLFIALFITSYPKFIFLVKEQNGVVKPYDYIIAAIFASIPLFNVYVTYIMLPSKNN